MTTAVKSRTLSDRDMSRLDVLRSGVVDLRRDVHRFVGFVEQRGIVRTCRDNKIPLGAARRLAGLLSWAGEKQAVEDVRGGAWSAHVCAVARELGLVSYDTKGIYAGYSSTSPSFPDNEVKLQAPAWRAWGKRSALQKERALLDVLLETTPNEFFDEPTLVEGTGFDGWGCATGPAGKMDLPRIRRSLLDLLATLEPGTWIEFTDLVDLLGSRHPQLILDPAHRQPSAPSRRAQFAWEHQSRGPKPPLVLEDIYVNFRESGAKKGHRGARGEHQITSETPGAFRRVEGRYLEFFLREIPYILGYVELGYRRASDRHGLDVLPPFERLRALRTMPRLRQILGNEPAFDAVTVTVLPTFEVLVEAPSYPESTLDALAPYACVLSEDRYVHQLRLEKARVVEAAAAADGTPSCASLLERLSGRPLPQNVAFEVANWTSRGERVTLREGLGILEVAGDGSVRREALGVLGDLVVEDRIGSYVLVREPERAFSLLETHGLVPLARAHPATGFAQGDGPLGRTMATKRAKGTKRPGSAPTKARLSTEDLVGYRSDEPALLDALEQALPQGRCSRLGPDRLVVPAAWMPRVRKALRTLRARFDVTLEDEPLPALGAVDAGGTMQGPGGRRAP